MYYVHVGGSCVLVLKFQNTIFFKTNYTIGALYQSGILYIVRIVQCQASFSQSSLSLQGRN